MHPLTLTRPLRSLVAVAACSLATASTASAHFIWIHLIPEGPRPVAEIFLGDGIDQEDAAGVAGYLEGLRAWTADGTSLACTARSFGLSTSLPEDTDLIGASKSMGAYTPSHGGDSRLLEFYAKGAANLAAAGRTLGTRAELIARSDGDELVLTVLFDGEPAAGAEVRVPVPGTTAQRTLAADQGGEVRVLDPKRGSFSVRGRVVVPIPGVTEDGEPFAAIHHHATLVIASLRETPLPEGASPVAYERLESAYECRATWPRAVVGVAGNLEVQADGRVVQGAFVYREGRVTLELPGEEPAEWVSRALRRVFDPCMATPFEEEVGSRPLTLEPRERHPFGRRVSMNDGTEGSYRVHGREIRQVVRTVDGRRTVCSVLENEELEDGRFLPRHFTVATYDANSDPAPGTTPGTTFGDLLRTETHTDTYTEVDGTYLPRSRRILISEDGGTRAVCLEFRDLELLPRSGE